MKPKALTTKIAATLFIVLFVGIIGSAFIVRADPTFVIPEDSLYYGLELDDVIEDFSLDVTVEAWVDETLVNQLLLEDQCRGLIDYNIKDFVTYLSTNTLTDSRGWIYRTIDAEERIIGLTMDISIVAPVQYESTLSEFDDVDNPISPVAPQQADEYEDHEASFMDLAGGLESYLLHNVSNSLTFTAYDYATAFESTTYQYLFLDNLRPISITSNITIIGTYCSDVSGAGAANVTLLNDFISSDEQSQVWFRLDKHAPTTDNSSITHIYVTNSYASEMSVFSLPFDFAAEDGRYLDVTVGSETYTASLVNDMSRDLSQPITKLTVNELATAYDTYMAASLADVLAIPSQFDSDDKHGYYSICGWDTGDYLNADVEAQLLAYLGEEASESLVQNGLRDWFAKAASWVKSTAQKVGTAVKTGLQKLGTGIKDTAKKIWNSKAITAARDGVTRCVEGVSRLGGNIVNGVADLTQAGFKAITKAVPVVVNATSKLIQGIGAAAGKLVNTGANIIQGVGGGLAKLGKRLPIILAIVGVIILLGFAAKMGLFQKQPQNIIH